MGGASPEFFTRSSWLIGKGDQGSSSLDSVHNHRAHSCMHDQWTTMFSRNVRYSPNKRSIHGSTHFARFPSTRKKLHENRTSSGTTQLLFVLRGVCLSCPIVTAAISPSRQRAQLVLAELKRHKVCHISQAVHARGHCRDLLTKRKRITTASGRDMTPDLTGVEILVFWHRNMTADHGVFRFKTPYSNEHGRHGLCKLDAVSSEYRLQCIKLSITVMATRKRCKAEA